VAVESSDSGVRDYSRLASTAFARERLARHAVVVGAGALGNEVTKNLALLGLRRITVIDRDYVESSNLSRSVLFCTPDIAADIAARTPKAIVVSRRLVELNPDVVAQPVVGEIADVGLGLLRRADIVFSCLDNEMARLELSWACWRLDRLLVDGGLGWMNYSSGQVTVFPGGGAAPCYACRKGAARRRELLQELHGREDPCWRKEKQAAAGDAVATTPVMASIVSALQVELGLRTCGQPHDAQGRACRITLHPVAALESAVFDQSPTCPLHDPSTAMTSVLECADGCSTVWTPADVLRACDRPHGHIVLDWPITARARCRACGHEWEPLVRRARFRRQVCPACGADEPIPTQVLTVIDWDSPWSSRTLAQLGLPAGHIYEVVEGGGESAPVHVEITGDLMTAPPC
jgi:adenylyltransferase/sulfurtransferase